MTAAPWLRSRRALALCLLPLVVLPARAALWTLERAAQARTEFNDNPSLAPSASGVTYTQSISGTLIGARQTESSSTRLDASATALWSPKDASSRRVDGRLGLSQSLMAPLDAFSAAALWQQNTTFDNTKNNTDVALGRGKRRSGSLSGSWTHALNERWSLGSQLSWSRTGYGSELNNAVDFRNGSASADLSYRLSERDSLRLQFNRTDFKTLTRLSNRARTDDWSLGYSHALSETSNLSLNAGQFRTDRRALSAVTVCPLPISFCSSGLIQPVLAQGVGNSSESGRQYAASYNQTLSELSDVSLSVSRAQAPSGAGVVVLADNLALAARRSITPTLSLTLNLSASRSSYTGVSDGPTPTFQKLALSGSWQLAENFTMQAALEHYRSHERRSGVGARANGVSVVLKYDGARLFATR